MIEVDEGILNLWITMWERSLATFKQSSERLRNCNSLKERKDCIGELQFFRFCSFWLEEYRFAEIIAKPFYEVTALEVAVLWIISSSLKIIKYCGQIFTINRVQYSHFITNDHLLQWELNFGSFNEFVIEESISIVIEIT